MLFLCTYSGHVHIIKHTKTQQQYTTTQKTMGKDSESSIFHYIFIYMEICMFLGLLIKWGTGVSMQTDNAYKYSSIRCAHTHTFIQLYVTHIQLQCIGVSWIWYVHKCAQNMCVCWFASVKTEPQSPVPQNEK